MRFVIAVLLFWCVLCPGRLVGQEAAPSLVTIGGTVTEIVYALGAEDQIVAVDASSVYPAEAQDKPQVGYMRQVSSEGILSVAPDLVLASSATRPTVALDQVRSAGVAVEVIEEAEDVAGAIARIRAIAALLNREVAGERVVAALEEDMAAAREASARVETPPRALFIYARGSGTLQVAGRNTSAETMIELAGGQNAMQQFEGFRPLTAEGVVGAAPDVLVLLDRGLDSIGGASGLFDQPGLEATPAGANERVVTIDDLKFLGFGPRMGEAVLTLAQYFQTLPETSAHRR
ncbi:MAG: ABC transporter substrate-binding protein [Bacteroidetes bacterium]|jgi:iron complex transport system substrate-binding protein|nr:ABC transporter substrate-binding protein [Bacteroidota bacterium]